MSELDPELQRLLRAASAAEDRVPAEIPFGFDTRVLATWRSLRSENGADDLWAFARTFRRVATGAMVVIVCAGAGAWWQLQASDDLDEAGNAYAMADSVIELGTVQ